MDVRTVCCTAAFIGVSLSLAAGPPKNVTVRSIVLDYAADIAPGLNIQSDGLGDYLNSTNLKSQIQAIGDWELDAINPKNATRRIYLDFSQPIAGSAPGGANPTAPPSAIYKFRALAQCSLYGNSLLDFAAGEQKTCPLRIGIHLQRRTVGARDESVCVCERTVPGDELRQRDMHLSGDRHVALLAVEVHAERHLRREWFCEVPERGTAPRNQHVRRTDRRHRSRRLLRVLLDPADEVARARITDLGVQRDVDRGSQFFSRDADPADLEGGTRIARDWSNGVDCADVSVDVLRDRLRAIRVTRRHSSRGIRVIRVPLCRVVIRVIRVPLCRVVIRVIRVPLFRDPRCASRDRAAISVSCPVPSPATAARVWPRTPCCSS